MSKMLHEVKPEYQHEAPQKTGRDDVAVGMELAEAAASSAEAVAMILSVADQKRSDVMKAGNEPPVRVEDFDTEIANMAKDLKPFKKIDGWQRCLVCRKWSNEEHVKSAAHQSAMATQAGLQLFCGRPTMNDGFAIYAHGCVPEPGAKEISWDRLKRLLGRPPHQDPPRGGAEVPEDGRRYQVQRPQARGGDPRQGHRRAQRRRHQLPRRRRIIPVSQRPQDGAV